MSKIDSANSLVEGLRLKVKIAIGKRDSRKLTGSVPGSRLVMRSLSPPVPFISFGN